jgi:hypothetical protein
MLGLDSGRRLAELVLDHGQYLPKRVGEGMVGEIQPAKTGPKLREGALPQLIGDAWGFTTPDFLAGCSTWRS